MSAIVLDSPSNKSNKKEDASNLVSSETILSAVFAESALKNLAIFVSELNLETYTLSFILNKSTFIFLLLNEATKSKTIKFSIKFGKDSNKSDLFLLLYLTKPACRTWFVKEPFISIPLTLKMFSLIRYSN